MLLYTFPFIFMLPNNILCSYSSIFIYKIYQYIDVHLFIYIQLFTIYYLLFKYLLFIIYLFLYYLFIYIFILSHSIKNLLIIYILLFIIYYLLFIIYYLFIYLFILSHSISRLLY